MLPNRLALNLAFALLAALLAVDPAFANRRIALVIGNGSYDALPTLPNPPNEAARIGEALKRLGYEATIAVDLNKQSLNDAILEFAASVRDADVALFYFTGHGYQIGSENFLISTDTPLAGETPPYQQRQA